MLDPKNIPKIHQEEKLARYALSKKHFRKSSLTVRPDAFIPHPYSALSVTRHRDATEIEVWNVGRNIATDLEKKIYGRADIQVYDFLEVNLSVEPAPKKENPNHANITGWPKEKPMQKIIAQEVAAKAQFVLAPELR